MSETVNSRPLKDFWSWFQNYLKDEDLQFTRCGFKGEDDIGKHEINLDTGAWSDPKYSLSKPLRWLLNVRISPYTIEVTSPYRQDSVNIGYSNTSNGKKVALAVRVVPLISLEDSDTWEQNDQLEFVILFVFPKAVPVGGAAEPFAMDIHTGEMTYKKDRIDYIFCGILALIPYDTVVYKNETYEVTYGQIIGAISETIVIEVGETRPLPYNLTEPGGADHLKRDIINSFDENRREEAIRNALLLGEAQGDLLSYGKDNKDLLIEDAEDTIPPISKVLPITADPDLIGVDSSVYEQINAALESGKQHLMFYGPPGTGKTTLARWLATALAGQKWILLTGSADWSSQDLIGGYQAAGASDIKFVPGVLLQHFDKPLIIDELNRCDIDRVIGPLFTVLSGHQTSLPYRTDITKKDSPQYIIFPKYKPNLADHEFAPGPGWRLIATLNSIDKSSIHQMSYALTRRFGWIYVDAPRDLQGFLREFVTRKIGAAPPDGTCPLADIWQAINQVRVIGAAPILDALGIVGKLAPGVLPFGEVTPELRSAILNAFDMVMLPMLDGITSLEARQVAAAVVVALGLTGEEKARIEARLASAAV